MGALDKHHEDMKTYPTPRYYLPSGPTWWLRRRLWRGAGLTSMKLYEAVEHRPRLSRPARALFIYTSNRYAAAITPKEHPCPNRPD